MARFRRKLALLEAIQWFRNGDHPNDRSTQISPGGSSTSLSEGRVVGFFRQQHVPGDRICAECGTIMHKHGLLKPDNAVNGEELIHPGDYILTDSKGRYYRRSAKDFEANFEPYEEPIVGETAEMTGFPTQEDFDSLAERVKTIEDHFTGPENSNLERLHPKEAAYRAGQSEPEPVTPDLGNPQ